MTEQEWQDRYRITSIKGKIWKRADLRNKAVMITASLVPEQPRLAVRTAVQLVLDDVTFMRLRTGEVPARVIDDAGMEAFLNLTIPDRHAATTAFLASVKGIKS
jgi:hypothetical protein